MGQEKATAGAGARLELAFEASDVYLVLGGTGTVKATVGSHTQTVDVSGIPRLYTLVYSPTYESATLVLSFSPGCRGLRLHLRLTLAQPPLFRRVSPTTTRPEAVMVEDLSDPRRPEPPYVATERAMLERWLEFHRTTLLLKCEGLDDAARKARPVATSLLSLHGLVRHMAEVERGWFRRTLLRRARRPPDLVRPRRRGQRARSPRRCRLGLRPGDLAGRVRAEPGGGRGALARRHRSPSRRAVSLRWIYVHMIEEYARHNGHADLIRELVDGTVGW